MLVSRIAFSIDGKPLKSAWSTKAIASRITGVLSVKKHIEAGNESRHRVLSNLDIIPHKRGPQIGRGGGARIRNVGAQSSLVPGLGHI